MKICGVEGLSLIDYPGKLAAVLFLGGCNFRCPFCHNTDLVLRSDALPAREQDEIIESLGRRKALLDGVVVTGGEPLVHGDELVELLTRLHAGGFLVKLDTNGYQVELLLHVLASGLADYVAMDVKTSFEKYDLAAGRPVDTGRIAAAIEGIKQSGVNHEFRTTCVPGLVELDDVLTIAAVLGPDEQYFLQQFRAGAGVLDPAWANVPAYAPSMLRSFVQVASGIVRRVALRGC